MKAYNEIYLDDAMKNLGEAFDYAVNACHIPLDTFTRLFEDSSFSSYFSKGNPKYVSGMSGMELVIRLLESIDLDLKYPTNYIEYEYSKEYWIGWILAYYQWTNGYTFKSILDLISVYELDQLYPTLHECSLEKCVETINQRIEKKNRPTKLQTQRKIYGYSQRELSIASGVNLRTLQQYELNTKDIKKASVETVLNLANALGCKIEDIIE